MVTKDAAKPIVDRLRSLPFDGDMEDSNGRRREVGEAIMRQAENEQHVQSIVEHLLTNCRTYPLPMDVESAIRMCPPPGVSHLIPIKEDCSYCSGSGWERTEHLSGHTAVDVCRCRKVPVSA